MLTRSFKISVFLVVCGLALGMPGASAQKSKKGLSADEKAALESTFVNANREKIIGNIDASAKLFLSILDKDPTNDAAAYNLAMIYESQNLLDGALLYAKQAAELSEDNTYYQELLADIYLQMQNADDAIKIYAKLAKRFPNITSYQFKLASVYYASGKLADAAKIYDKLELQLGLSPELSLQKKTLYLRLNKIDKAVEEMNRLIAAFPSEIEYYGELANLYQANNMYDEAYAVFQKMLSIDPSNGLIHLSLSEFYRSKGDNKRSFEELTQAFQSKNVRLETKLKVLASYFYILQRDSSLRQQAYVLNEALVKAHSEEAPAYAIYGEFLYQEKKFEQARDQYRKSIEIDRKNFGVWQSLLRVELDINDFKSLEQESDSALALFPSQPLVYYLNGIAKVQLRKYKESIEVLKSGSKLVVDNNSLLAEFYTNLGEAHYRLKEMPACDEAFDKAIQLDPKNANTLNNYSYYLSLRNEFLQKAEALSKSSNELDPNNSYYEDTYGWIMYQLGKYAEAKEWLEKAIKSRKSESSVLYEHYGDILIRLGDVPKALEYWQKARKIGGDTSEFLDKKIADQKLYE